VLRATLPEPMVSPVVELGIGPGIKVDKERNMGEKETEKDRAEDTERERV
jgi:hypothetical protein